MKMGEDKFVGAVVGSLNKMNTTKAGRRLLSELRSSKNYFDFTNSFAKDSNGKDIKKALIFSGYKNGGGEIKAGAFLNVYMQKSQRIESAAHELFHGYQAEKGERVTTINREIGAYLFGRAILMNLGYPVAAFGNFTKAGKKYDESMNKLLRAKTLDPDLYNAALQNFKEGSFDNASGLYKNFKIFPNENNPAIKSFFPLIK
jgi:hypothetical protein